ncbi:RAP, putative [Babesia ovata]|uniref:RAP, putative n=1 Tax=Babesia ovata TaxID=189622 RepID=A0A2H6KD61_9APIC|nr:RAP, putative [Babesia ovata]GBE60936.1 RAP, putative [Babesia ovata]
MYLQPRGASAVAGARFLARFRREFAFRIVRVPKSDAQANKYRAIHEALLPPQELQKATREQLMTVYGVLGVEDSRERLDQDYVQRLLERTVALGRALLPADYAKIFMTLRWVPTAASGFTSELNEGVRRLGANFSTREIALILRAYASLASRSLITITELVKTFNRHIGEADVWHVREVASALATLRVPVTGPVEIFYKRAVALVPKHIAGMPADDIGIFLNSFARQRVSQDELLHFADAHADRLISEASHRNVALIANSFARVERHSRRLLQAVEGRLHRELEKYWADKRSTETSMEVLQPYVGPSLGRSTSPALDPVYEYDTDDVSVRDLEHQLPTTPQAAATTVSEAPLKLIDVAMIFNAFIKLEEDCTKLLNAFIPWLNNHIDSESPTLSLVLLCHAYSRAGINNRELFMRMAQVILQRVNTLNCQQLGLVAVSYAKAGQHVPLLFLRLADEVIYRGTVALKFKRYNFDFQSLEHLMQAFSRVGFKDQRLYVVLTTLLKRQLRAAGSEEINGEMIASMLTSMAPRRVEAFVPFITDAIVRTRDKTAYSTSALCRVLNAFVKLKVSHSKIMDSMLKEVKDRVNEFQIPVLINTLKALAKLKRYNLVLVKDSIKRCSLHLVHLTTHDITNMLSALNGMPLCFPTKLRADFGFRNTSFLQKLAMCIKHRIADFDRNQLHMIFSRLAMLRTSDADLYRQLFPLLLKHQHDFSEVQLADISVSYIYVLVHFDYLQRELHLQKAARHESEYQLQSMQHREISQGPGHQPVSLQKDDSEPVTDPSDSRLAEDYSDNSVGMRANGAHRNAGEEHPSALNPADGGPHAPYRMPDPATNVLPYGFTDGILDAMLSHLGSKLDVATVFKVQTVHLYLKHIRRDIYDKLSAKTLEVLRKCSAVRFALAEYMLTSSSAHKEVSHLLNLMGVFHRNEVQFGPYLIDIVPETGPARRVAIEYDGPAHFYAETTMRTAKSILKHEILNSAGWQVIHVPHQEWAQLGGFQVGKDACNTVSTKQKMIYLDRIRRLYEVSPLPAARPLLTTGPVVTQARHFSSCVSHSALEQKRRELLKVNEQILKQHLENPDAGSESFEEPRKPPPPSATERIVDEICNRLMEGSGDITDLDDGDAEKLASPEKTKGKERNK